MGQITLPADSGRLKELFSFVGGELNNHGCLMEAQPQIELAIEEIFINIAQYAYEEAGDVTVRLTIDDTSSLLTLCFIDSGKPFNPLEKGEPDIYSPLEERDIGGLGIHLVKSIMDDIEYENKNGENILTLKKYLSRNQ